MNNKSSIILNLILLALIGCKTSKVYFRNCDSNIESVGEDPSLEDFDKWEECLIQEAVNTKRKQQLYDDIKGNEIQQGLLGGGISGEVSHQYISHRALSLILSEREITKNLSSQDPGIKYNSFFTIAKRNNRDVFESLQLILSDSTKVHTIYACIGDDSTLADVCVDLVIGRNHIGEVYQLNEVERSQLDSIAIARKLNLNYLKYRK